MVGCAPFSLCRLGAVFQHSYTRGAGGAGAGAAVAYCARPGLRLWRADRTGAVLHTLMFKVRATILGYWDSLLADYVNNLHGSFY